MAPTERINNCTRVITLKREQKPRVEMNPGPDQSSRGSGNSPPPIPLQMPKELPLFFFFLFVRPPSWCLCYRAQLWCSSRGQLCNGNKSPLTSRPHDPSRSLETVRETRAYTHTPTPPHYLRRLVFTSFLGCTFSYRLFPLPPSPFERTEGTHTEIFIRPRSARPRPPFFCA